MIKAVGNIVGTFVSISKKVHTCDSRPDSFYASRYSGNATLTSFKSGINGARLLCHFDLTSFLINLIHIVSNCLTCHTLKGSDLCFERCYTASKSIGSCNINLELTDTNQSSLKVRLLGSAIE